MTSATERPPISLNVGKNAMETVEKVVLTNSLF